MKNQITTRSTAWGSNRLTDDRVGYKEYLTGFGKWVTEESISKNSEEKKISEERVIMD